MKNEAYKHRIIDEIIDHYLNAFGAVCIEGPKCLQGYLDNPNYVVRRLDLFTSVRENAISATW